MHEISSNDLLSDKLSSGTYRVDGVLNGLLSKGNLVDIESLALQLTQLVVIHLAATQNLQSTLLERVQAGATGSRHLLFQICQLLITLIDLCLDHFTSLIQLFKQTSIRLYTTDIDSFKFLPFEKSL